ncbi:formylglycine-generating enzyme family protein [Desulfoluna butyratoxydans]|uniref:C-type lectin fold n=1 Tax=Desulfoluna butyratoxydans TaxID=231438 RepID=A0A4U8YYQ0_9BACT|nr:formylglycine-generating enzyme family protein [Desulfoluna butyratoxydans]VFQ47332.1 c-type lectin fold [Desulfoluna butyratoxydans]
MPRLILPLIAVFLLVTPCFAAELPDVSSRVLPDLTEALTRYRDLNRALDETRRARLQEIERAYYLKLNSLRLESPKPPKPRGMFETTEEYKERLASYRKKLDKVRTANHDTLADMEQRGVLRIQVAEVEVDWLESQLTRLAPLAETIDLLQEKGCIVSRDSATITVQRPDADTFRFPVTINHNGTLYRDTWTYPDRDRAETIWRLRHDLKVFPYYTPVPAENDGIELNLTAFMVTGPDNVPLMRFPVDTAEPFDEVKRLARIRSDELPAARVLLALSNSVEGPLPGMRFVFISPRTFTMGSPKDTPGRLPDERLHKVRLTRPFYMQTTEVTQAQWETVMGENPSAFPYCGGDCPVENIYWQDAQRFITRLNARYKGKGRFRLPTEAEWEYTARTGSTDPWDQPGGDAGAYAWFRSNSGDAPHKVATRRSNLWNIYDMNGNVSEWCSDWYGPYPELPMARNPKGPVRGDFRVSRGGSWFHGIDSIRGAHRNSDNAGDKGGYIGFRLVLEIPTEALNHTP